MSYVTCQDVPTRGGMRAMRGPPEMDKTSRHESARIAWLRNATDLMTAFTGQTADANALHDSDTLWTELDTTQPAFFE